MSKIININICDDYEVSSIFNNINCISSPIEVNLNITPIKNKRTFDHFYDIYSNKVSKSTDINNDIQNKHQNFNSDISNIQNNINQSQNKKHRQPEKIQNQSENLNNEKSDQGGQLEDGIDINEEQVNEHSNLSYKEIKHELDLQIKESMKNENKYIKCSSIELYKLKIEEIKEISKYLNN